MTQPGKGGTSNPVTAVILGVVMVLVGAVMLLAVAGVLPLRTTLYAPRWVAAAMSVVFLLGGWLLAITAAQNVFEAPWLTPLRNGLVLGTVIALLVPLHWLASRSGDPITRWTLRFFLALLYATALASWWLRRKLPPSS